MDITARAVEKFRKSRLGVAGAYTPCDAPAIYATGLTATVFLAIETATGRKVAIKVRIFVVIQT
jgi:hypothetical protein